MERFELVDIVGQSHTGIVYRAIDNHSTENVAIHRFFPFGQNNGGLDEVESSAFEAASERLANARHPALRSVISGGTDPIDRIPYLAMEWVEGISLGLLLADEALEAGLVIDILRLAIEVSIAISETLEKEQVWVKTSLDSIVVGTEESGRGFTFCISPIKCLGAQSEGKNLLSIVKLGENLIGWKGRLVSDRSGHGLGGWFKILKHRPETNLRDALDSLNRLTAGISQDMREPVKPFAIKPVAKPKKGVSKTTLAAVALLALSVPAALLLYLHKTAQAPAVELGYSEQEITSVVAESDARTSSSIMGASATLSDQEAKIVSNSIRIPASVKSDVPQPEPQRTSAAVQPPTEQTIVHAVANETLPPPILLEWSNKKGAGAAISEESARTLKQGSLVRLKGQLSKVKNSSSSIYLDFSSTASGDSLRGVIRKNEFDGESSPQTFEKFRGKTITLNGRIITQKNGKLPLVKIITMKELAVAK